MTIVCSHFDSGVELLQRQCKISADKITQLENELKSTKESHEQLKIQLDTGYSITDSHRDDSIICSGDYPSNVADDISQTSSSWTEIHEDPLDDPWRNISSPIRGSPLSPLAICSDRDSSHSHSDFKSFKSICTCRLSPCGGLICDGSDTNHTNTSSIQRLWGESEARMGTRLIENSVIECDAEGDVRESKRSHSHSNCRTCAFCSEYGDCVHRYLESNMDKSTFSLHDRLSQLTSDLADRTVEAQSLSTTNIVLEARIIELQAQLQHSPFTPGKISGELFKECSRLRWRIVELEKGFSAQQKNMQIKEKEEKEEKEAAAAAVALQPIMSCSTDTLTIGVIEAGAEMPFSVMASTRKRGYKLRKSISNLQCSSVPYSPSPSSPSSFSPSFSPSLSQSPTTPSCCMAHSPSSPGPSVSCSCSSPGPTLLQKMFKSESERKSESENDVGGSISQSQPNDNNSSNNSNSNNNNNKKKQYAAFQDCVKSPTSVLDIVSMIEQEHEGREFKLKLKVNAEDDKIGYRKRQFRDGIMETIDYKEKIALKLEIEKKEKERMLADEMHYYQLQRLMGKVSELMGIHDRKEEGFRVLIEGLEEQLMAATNALCIAQDIIQTQAESQKVNVLESESPNQRDYFQSNHCIRKGCDNAAYSVQEDAVIERDIEELELEEEEEEVEAGLRLASTLMTVSTASIKEKSDNRKQQSSDADVKRTMSRDSERERENKGDGEQKSAGSADGTCDSLHGDSNSRTSAIHSNSYLSSLLYMELGKSESPSHTLSNRSHIRSHSHSVGGACEDIVTESSISSSLPSCMTSPATSPTSASPAEHYHHHHHHSGNDGDDEGGNENVCGRIRWKNDNSDLHLSTERLRKQVALRGRVSHDWNEIGYTQ